MKQFNDFTLIEQRTIEEEEATLYWLQHKKTKARLLYMDVDDPNKVFMIGFRTPPLGSTGNCHILEHCVLNGSRKYQTKEPFMDLLKSSLQTFLNAMTYPDRTVYPVASRNDADFANLMDLYLDSVFFPRAVEDPLIFRQEGWRHEIFSKEEDIRLQGVVYNEMKGAMSSSEDQVSDQVNRGLYPDTIYAENSGGDPYAIPDLTFEEFKNYHEDYYHPSNSWTFLYGAINEEECFNRLNDYFELFSEKEVKSLPEPTAPFSAPKRSEVSYSLGRSENGEKKAYLSYSWLVGRPQEEERMILQLLPEVLVNSEAAPLRQQLLKELDCEDVYAQLHPVNEVGFSIIVKHVDESRADRFKELVDRSLQKSVADGLDRELLEGELRAEEFNIREKGSFATKGIVIGLSIFNDWFYDESPIRSLLYRERLDRLKENLDRGVVESYIDRKLIQNPHSSFILHRPVPGMNAQKEADVQNKLADFQRTLSSKQLDQLIEENLRLQERQNRPDSQEARMTIPKLTRSDLPLEIPAVPRQIKEFGPDRYLCHPLASSGIHYLDIVFDARHISREEAPYMALVCELIGMLDTAHRSYGDYANKEALYTGGISASPRLYRKINRADDAFDRKVILSTKFLGFDNMEKGLELLDEQVFESDFSDRDRIMEVLLMARSYYQSGLIQSGHSMMRSRAVSSLQAMENYNQQINGIDYYLFLKDMADDFSPEKHEKLVRVYRKLFSGRGRIVNLTTDQGSMNRFLDMVKNHVDRYPQEELTEAPISFSPFAVREAFISSTDVQFVSKAASFGYKDDLFRGDLIILQKILSDEYLYNEIRAKGGAYGAGLVIGMNGILSTYSYRDPHILRTIDCYDRLDKAASDLHLTDEDLDFYLVGAIGSYDQPLTASQQGRHDLNDFIMGKSADRTNRILRDMLESKKEDFEKYVDRLARIRDDLHLAVLGSEEQIMSHSKLFDKILHI